MNTGGPAVAVSASNKTNDDSLATELVTAFIEWGKDKPLLPLGRREAVIALLAAVVADAERSRLIAPSWTKGSIGRA